MTPDDLDVLALRSWANPAALWQIIEHPNTSVETLRSISGSGNHAISACATNRLRIVDPPNVLSQHREAHATQVADAADAAEALQSAAGEIAS